MTVRFDSKWHWAAAFAVLSVLDLYLTWLLIESFSGCVYESNPLAAWILERHGWLGLGSYKLACSALVVFLGILVSRFRPHTGKRLLAGSTLMLAVVTGYSLFLWAAPALASEELGGIHKLRIKERLLEQQHQEVRAFAEASQRLSEELVEGRLSVTLAAAELDHQRMSFLHYDPVYYLRQRYPGLTDETCLAASLIRAVAATLSEQPSRCLECVQRLTREFETHYQVPLPPFARFGCEPPEPSRAPAAE